MRRSQVSREKLVNTRRLEQLLTDQTEADGPRSLAPAPLRRGLAVSGARDTRRVGGARQVSARNAAVIEANWASLDPLERDPKPDLRRHQFNEIARQPQIASLFDVLRAQLVQAFEKRKFRTLGVTSPHAGAGASYTVAGLLASFARRKEARVVGLDLNLTNPSLHSFFEVLAPGSIKAMIDGDVPVESHLRRATAHLALGLNAEAQSDAGAVIEKAVFAEFMADMLQFLEPDIVVCDLPPLLEGDAALSTLHIMDAVLVVADAKRSTAAQIAECERILTDQAEFLGVILNRNVAAKGGR